MSSRTEITHYAFIDVETTGLDQHRDPIIEIAMVLTDIDLQVITTYSKAIDPGPGLLQSRLEVNQFVKDMHTENGLLSCIEQGNCDSITEAERQIIALLTRHVEGGPGSIMIAGSGVAQFDQPVLRLQMPSLSKWFAYYPMDIGVIRRFIKYTLKREDMLLPDEPAEHRALPDVVRAIDEARYYRDCMYHTPHSSDTFDG